MGVEIERKFLVDKEKWNNLDKRERSYYRQGYIVAESGNTVRVRLTDQEAYLTIKGAAVSLARPEYEYVIPKQDAKELLDTLCGSVIEKIRYRLFFEGKLWEVDEFLGDNKGLIVAEIELDSEDEKFELPEWVSEEVTGERKYYNSSLSVKPYKSW